MSVEWSASGKVIYSSDFEYDVKLTVDGDFGSDDERDRYIANLVSMLNYGASAVSQLDGVIKQIESWKSAYESDLMTDNHVFNRTFCLYQATDFGSAVQKLISDNWDDPDASCMEDVDALLSAIKHARDVVKLGVSTVVQVGKHEATD